MLNISKSGRSRSIRQASIALTLMASLSLAACSGSSGSNNGGGAQTYSIGVLVPLTGVHAADGPVTRHGVDLAIKQITTSRVLGDDKLKVEFADNQAAPDVAVSAFNQMLSLHHSVASLTGFSGPTLAIAPIATRSKVVLVNTGGVTPQLSHASPYLFNLVPLIDQPAKVMMNYVADNGSAKRIALLYTNDALGNGTKAGFGDIVKGAGLTYTGGVAFDGTATDYRAAISKVQSLKPDLVYMTPSSDQAGNIIKQAGQIGFKPIWAGYSGFAHSGTITIGGQLSEGGLVTVPSSINPETGKEYDAYQGFAQEWRAEFKTAPDYLGETAYDATIMLAHAIADAKKSGEVTGQSVQKAMFGLDHPSIFGASVDKKGRIFQSVAVEEIKNKEFKVVKVYGPKQLAEIG